MADRSSGNALTRTVAWRGLGLLVRMAMLIVAGGLELVVNPGTTQAVGMIQVVNTDDSGPGSLRAAIASAAPGDTIVFAIPSGSPGCTGDQCIVGLTSGALVIDKNLAIVGNGPSLTIVRRRDDAATAFGIFQIAPSREVTISGLAIAHGGAEEDGGGILNQGTLTLTYATIASSHANRFGGGIYNGSTGTLRVSNTYFHQNAAHTSGGAVYNASGGKVALTAVTFTDNGGTAPGSAIYNGGGVVTLTNSTVDMFGWFGVFKGIIFNHGGSTTIVSSTLSARYATGQGAEGKTVTNQSGTVLLKNSLLGAGAGGTNCSGPMSLAGNNVVNDVSCGTTANPAVLGPPVDNGGFTPTILLAGPTPALDGGDPAGCLDADGQPLLTDQRGVPRPQGGRCDIGAVEMVPPSGFSPPVFAALRDVAFQEDGTGMAFTFGVADSDRPANQSSLFVTVSSSDPALLPPSEIQATPSTGQGRPVRVIMRSAPERYGTATLSVSVTDQHAQLAVTMTTTVNVLPVNDPPSFTGGGDVSTNGGQQVSRPWATAISPGPNEASQNLTFVVTPNTPAHFAEQPTIDASGTLRFRPVPAFNGETTVAVLLKDDGGTANGGVDTSTTSTFKVTVTGNTQVPQGADDRYDAVYGTPLTVPAPGVLANDTDPHSRPLSAIVVAPPAHGSVTLATDGAFVYRPNPGFSGIDRFTYRPTVGALSGNTVTVSVTVAASTTACTPRQHPKLQMERAGAGRLRVTVSAQPNNLVTNNSIQQVQFGEARNARVEVPGAAAGTNGGPSSTPGQPAGTPGGFVLTLQPGTQSTTFFVQRQAPGDFRVNLTVVDACGAAGDPFKTFVGGGVNLP